MKLYVPYKDEKTFNESRGWFMPALVIGFCLVVMIFQSGCQMIKGGCGDAAWIFDKIDQSIVVQE